MVVLGFRVSILEPLPRNTSKACRCTHAGRDLRVRRARGGGSAHQRMRMKERCLHELDRVKVRL